ncbi:MAG: PAS domain-containing sensor histidine kinase [Candidatus Cryosericum sp.]
MMPERGIGAGEASEAQKRAAEALRESTECYKSLFQNNHAVMLLIDPDSGSIVDANRAASDYYGWTHEELLKKKISEINTLSVPEVHAEMQSARAETRNYFVFRHRRADGSIRDVEVYSGPLVLMGKTLLYSIVHDITEQRKGEERLRSSEQKFRQLFENLPAGFALHSIILDAQGKPCDYRFLEVNPAYEELMGLKGADIVGKTVLEVLPDLEPEWIERYGRVALSGGPVRFENFARALGKHFDVSAYSPAPGQFATVVLDITPRKRAEEELLKNEEQYHSLFDSMDIGVFFFQPGGTITFANPAALDILGVTLDEINKLEPTDPRWRNIRGDGSPFDDESLPSAIAVRTGQPVRDVTIGIYNAHEGAYRWVLGSSIPQFRPGETSPSLVYVTMVDITERRKAEQEKAFLQEQLIGSRKLEAIGQLAGGVAHNFNNLLTALMGSIEIARMDLPPGSPAAVDLEGALAAARKAAELTRQLLSFGRNAMIVPVAQNANALVSSAMQLICSSGVCSCTPGSADTVLDLSPDAWEVLADPSQMTQVLLELIKNAHEAMGDGGVVTIRTRNAAIGEEYVASHPYGRTGDFVVISVADTGGGIDPEIMQHLFEPFATTKQFGRGMGLAMVFGSLKQAGGWVDVSSDHGAGTEISLYLPRSTEKQHG